MLSLSANLIELGFDSIADNDGCCCSLLEGLTAVHLATYSASLTRCPAGSLSPKNILVIKNDRAKIPKNNRTISVQPRSVTKKRSVRAFGRPDTICTLF